jgi:inorganic triphosphatase YgiF
MSIETELKLRIAPEQLARLKRHSLFKTHQITAPVTLRLHNIYFDTPKLELHKRKMALRLRRVGGKWIQTLKGGGSVKAGLHERFEWEVPVPSAKLDFAGLDAVVWDEHLPPSLREKLKPVFVTDFFRSSRLIHWQGTVIEVCMDHGCVKTEEYSTPICELELELKSGDPRQLFELALAILAIASFELEVVSKAEQGFNLLSGHIPRPIKATLPTLSRKTTLADGLQTQIWSCLQHLQSNLRGAMESTDAEYLHQMRVALRRLRVVLRMAYKIYPDKELAGLRAELAALGVALGRIREWDVFIADIAQSEVMAEQVGFQLFLDYCEQQCGQCYATLRGREQADALQRLLLRFAIWMNGAYWQNAAQGAPNTRDYATRHLHQLARLYHQTGEQLDTHDFDRLHALRILAKKLRYSAEFFAVLYDQKKTASYLAALSEVQESLGKINDIAVAHRLLDSLAESPQLSEQLEIIAFAKQRVNDKFNFKFNELNDYIRHFNKKPPFWAE